MADYDDTNRGALFKNDKKEKDTHPDYKGSINVDGTEYWVSSWIKTSKAGGKFMSLSVTPKEEAKPTGKNRSSPQPDKKEELDDDIPFATASAYYDMTTSKQRRMSKYDF